MDAYLIGSYIGHMVRARDRHSVHSPFVYDLVEQVLRPDHGPPSADRIEALRKSALKDTTTLAVTDHGAGPRRGRSSTRTVATIARNALTPARRARMLYRLTRHLAVRHVLELGTSLGITTLYLAEGSAGGVITIEGCPSTAAIAGRHFATAGREDITLLTGSFTDRLPHALAQVPRLDLAYIDGHHAAAPTLAYFEQCLSKAHNNTAIVFDDIHWSREMGRAWERIKAHPRVTVTIDLYSMGLVFLRREQAREHFTLRY
jgi:predicted O-methyltransferase YrrM